MPAERKLRRSTEAVCPSKVFRQLPSASAHSLNVLSPETSTTSASVSCHEHQVPHQPVYQIRRAVHTHRQSSAVLVVHSMFTLHTFLKASCPEAGCTRCHDLHHGKGNTSWLRWQILSAGYVACLRTSSVCGVSKPDSLCSAYEKVGIMLWAKCRD